jgi:hypothetical protein
MMSDTVVESAPRSPGEPAERQAPPPRRPTVRTRLAVLALVPALAAGAGGTVALLRSGASGARTPAGHAHVFADLSGPGTTDLPPVSEAAFATDLAAADRASAADLNAGAAPAALKAAPTTVSAKDVDATLARRTAALRRHNESAFLATFDASKPALIRTERTLYRNLAKLPLVTPVYKEVAAGGTATARITYVGLIYQLKGVDLEPTTLTKLETWVRRGGKAVTTAVSAPKGRTQTRYAPLDQLNLTVRAGKAVTVVAGPDSAGAAAAVDAIAERAAAAVHGVWGSRPGPSRFILFTTRDPKAIGTWFGSGSAPIEAVGATLPERALLHPTRFAGSRVIVNLADVASLEELYRVLRHEFTHAVDVRAQVVPLDETRQSLPAWAEEGFAAWVEELDLPVQDSVYVHDLKALRSSWDRQLPPASREGFYAAGDKATYNYALANLVYRYVAKTYGNAKAVSFYAWYAAGHTDATSRILGVDEDTFRSGWADWVESVLG